MSEHKAHCEGERKRSEKRDKACSIWVPELVVILERR